MIKNVVSIRLPVAEKAVIRKTAFCRPDFLKKRPKAVIYSVSAW